MPRRWVQVLPPEFPGDTVKRIATLADPATSFAPCVPTGVADPTPETRLPVRDQLEQRTVGIVEVHAGSGPPRAATENRPLDDLDAVELQVRHRAGEGGGPVEAPVAFPREAGVGGKNSRLRPGAVHIELPPAEPVRPPPA